MLDRRPKGAQLVGAQIWWGSFPLWRSTVRRGAASRSGTGVAPLYYSGQNAIGSDHRAGCARVRAPWL